jgi:hypothetical protein
MGDVLDFARRLGDLFDVPLLAVAPQQQYPHAPEFYYPSGQREALSSTNNRAQLARWRPGHAIMAAMGGNVAVPDVDPRNGGDPERVRQLLDALHVRVYAEVETPGPGSGRHFYVAGQPKAVLVAASEDSWEHTIVPRLMAAGADLDLVYRVEVITSTNVHSEISMPQDLHDLEQRAVEVGAALLLLDPLMSRLSDRLDTHRDAEVRLALEPLAALANRAHLTVLGIIHHNKSGSTDPLQVIMGSRAFTAVARSVHTVILDPDDETNRRRLFGTPKNNLGRSDLATYSFVIDSFAIETDDGDLAWTGRLAWGAQSPASIHDAMERASESSDQKSAAEEAQGWLEDYLTSKGGTEESAKIKKAASSAGHSDKALRSARRRLKIEIEQRGFPRQTWWSLPNP